MFLFVRMRKFFLTRNTLMLTYIRSHINNTKCGQGYYQEDTVNFFYSCCSRRFDGTLVVEGNVVDFFVKIDSIYSFFIHSSLFSLVAHHKIHAVPLHTIPE